MATRKPKDTDVSLPFAALQLLAPPMRLVSAALWKALKQRDVMQYGTVEEFVTLACDSVPGMLTVRHQGKLTLGLRGRLILELLRGQEPDVTLIELHMKRIRAPAAPSSSLAAAVRKDVKIAKTVESFHSFVHALLTDPAEREQFFKEEFPVEYGPKYDEELEKLLWEFLIRLDQLLPVPNLAQTVSWLSDSPPVLEECARSATQPQLLNILLQHQSCLGHLEPAASLPPNMGDSILDSLSLPPSGRVASNPGAAKASAGNQAGKGKTPFIPVIGLINNEDVPVMVSASKRAATSKDATNSKFTVVKERQKPNDGGREGEEQLEGEREVSNSSRGTKRKQPDNRQSEFDEDEEEEEEDDVAGVTKSGKRKMSSVRQGSGDQRTSESEEEQLNGAALASSMTRLGVQSLHLPDDPSLCSLFECCLRKQARIIIEKLPVASAGASRTGGGATSFYNEDVPVMVSASKRAAASKDATNSKFTVVKERQKPNDGGREGEEQLEGERDVSNSSRGTKRKQPDNRQSEFDEDEEEEEEDDVAGVTKSGKRKMSSVRQGSGDQRTSESEEEQLNGAALASSMTRPGVQSLHLPDDLSLCSLFECCLRKQARIIIEKLPVVSAGASRTGGGATSFYKEENQRRRSPVKAPTHKSRSFQLEKPNSGSSGLDDKENHPLLSSASGSPRRRTNTETPAAAGGSEDYVADSEDEATKNFKGRLFMKRYYKTKHGTYVPTLREYWKPGGARRDLLSPASKRR
ncbi:TERF1-interacting nuclear factor 2 [Limanda limanda]|uniref:TERF1-interacting nuclear factor 2 n=1 Tax=Limanda limanda TaxID=27771 RepID=UPI0029C95F0E|nr:TERF1-interacting nuclear factor 2 [Limanda limanda]